MFGINFNFTAKDAGVYLGVPVAVGATVLLSKVAYNWWAGKVEAPNVQDVKSLTKHVVTIGGVGAAVGLTTAYLSKQPLGKEGLRAAGYTMGTIFATMGADSVCETVVK